jgi:pimeloyl-ACP methyl ester carboxylesterase
METTRSADGTTIAFDRVGQGPTLVIVGGAFGDRATPRAVADALAPHFTVVCYDRRGRGASGDTPPYAIEREVEDLDAVIVATGGSAFVYGHSSGAILALEAATRSEAIVGLTAYEPPYVVGDDRARTLDLDARVTALLAAGRPDDAMETFFLEGPQAPAEVVAAMKPTPAWQEMAKLAHTLPYDLALTGDQVIPVDRLATIGIPTLVLSGADSPLWARNAVTAVAEAIPGARHASLAGQTHAVSPDALVPVLREAFSA